MADLAMPRRTPAPPMNTQIPNPGDARELRALLEAVLDALTVPDDTANYSHQISNRALWVRTTLEGALAEDPAGIGWNADYLRRKVSVAQSASVGPVSELPEQAHADGDETRDFHAAVLEALDIPHPATFGDTEAHHAVLADRAMHAVIALRSVVAAEPYLDVAWTTAYLREQITATPTTGYRHAGQR